MRRIKFILCLLVLCMLPCICTWADTVLPFCINEICSGNGGHYTVNGTAPDYIELHNLTGKSVSLNGYFLSDDEDHLQKFSLDGYKIPSGGYLVLLADKKELPFKLSSSGEDLYLSDSNGLVLQHVTLPEIEKDSTYSLQADGTWHITNPTPMEANAVGIPYVKKVYVASPRFSHEAGFYDRPFDLTLEGYRTYKLYYTTDGSIPDENSILYTGPIHIEDATSNPNTLSMRTDITLSTVDPPSGQVKKATVIRAVAIDPDGNRSNDVTNSYFVGFKNYESYQDVPILSIVADPYDLFDEQDGIYVLGRTYQDWISDINRNRDILPQWIPTNYRNSGKEWEIPISIQWFDESNELLLSQNVGARIHGNFSRQRVKKSFNLYARKEYGSGTFQYDILKGLTEKKRVVVRGNLGADSLLHSLLEETGILTSPCNPCLVFINGEFWGLYEIREKQDEDDIAEFYGLNSDDLIVIKNNTQIAGAEPEVEKSNPSKALYRSLLSELSEIDPTTQYGYESIDEIIDIDNYITYIAALTFIGNRDYESNYTIWRTVKTGGTGYEDGRWRWIFQDLDNCCGTYEGATEIISLLPEDPIFSSLWRNKGFQTKFLTRLMDFANVELMPDYVEQFITPILTYYNPYLRETDIRFSVKNTSQKPGTRLISDLMDYFTNRRDNAIRILRDSLGVIRGTSTLKLSNLVQGISLEINDHQAHIYGSSWEGVYFKSCAVTFTAGDVPGYSFIGWYEGSNLISTDRTLEVSTDFDRTLTPVYEEQPIIALMNETEKIYSSGKFGFIKQLENSNEECLLLVDETITVKRKYKDNTLTFTTSEDVMEPQGFSMNIPLNDYRSAGVVLTLSVPYDASSWKWTVSCGNDVNTMKEIHSKRSMLSDGQMMISFDIPKDQIDNQKAFIRLEAVSRKGSVSFSLLGFRVYGIPLEPALARAYEFVRMLQTIDAEDYYYPDLGQMENWNPADIDEETTYLRNRLQVDMIREAITTVGTLGLTTSEIEGLERYPAVIFDDKVIAAYYNQDSIDMRCSITSSVYIYTVTDNGSLLLISTQTPENGVISIGKGAGTYIILDRPVEDIRFRITLESVIITNELLEAFSNNIPSSAIWMNVETFTRHQEEVPVILPDDWIGGNVFIYRFKDGNLLYVRDTKVKNGEITFTPSEGRFLLSDEPLESLEEQAELNQMEISDIKRTRANAKQNWLKMMNTLLISIAVFFSITVIGAVILIIYKHRKK